MSADPLDDRRTEHRRDRQRQPLPKRDEQLKFGIEGVQIRHRPACRQAKLVSERRRLEPPVMLERVRPCTDLAASEIEQAIAAFAGSAHDLPVHEIVGGERPRRVPSPAIVGEHLVSKIKIEHRGHGAPFARHRYDVRAIRKFFPKDAKIIFAEDRCPEVTDALGIDVIEPVYFVVDLRP